MSGGYDDRDGNIWLDGKLVPWREANIHVLTHALHYASSVFEGLRCYNGEPFALRQHSERLMRSAELMGFTIPWTVEQIMQACRDSLADSGLKDAYMRPFAWRGSEQMGVAAQKSKIHLAVACWSWGAYFGEEALAKGLRLDIASWRRPAPYTAPTESKAAGLYMICTMSKHQAAARGFDDAMMLDWRGQVAEATGANIFFWKDGVLHTPTPDCFLNGITRQTVIALAKKRGVQVVERAIWPEELSDFEQCFLTGSAAEVVPVGSIGPWNFLVGDETRQMMADYANHVRAVPANS